MLLLKTREAVEKRGVRVKLFDMWNDRFQPGDILHVFGSVKEALGLMKTAKTKGVRIVHCPIIWYNWQSSFKIAYTPRERLLCLLRQTVKTLLPAMPSERGTMMNCADLVLAGSEAEAQQIHRYFLVPADRLRVVTYGADEEFEAADSELFRTKTGLRDFVLAAGRIEPRKNQLNLIRALKGTGVPLVIAGEPVSTHRDYYDRCRQEAGPEVHFAGYLDRASGLLGSAYAGCGVFVLATWFETPGLAALEAALAGAKVVLTREGSTREYFGSDADYVNPASVADIRAKVLAALKKEKNGRLKERVRSHYLWKHSAEAQIKVYRELGLS